MVSLQDISEEYLDELTKPFFAPAGDLNKNPQPAPKKEADDVEHTISVKKNWAWNDQKVRFNNLYLVRFRDDMTVASMFGYKYIKKIEITKKGYYTLTIKDGGAINESWEMHAEQSEAEAQVKDMCRRAAWFMEYNIPVTFAPGQPEILFEYKPEPKPADAGNGAPRLVSRDIDFAGEEDAFDSQLDALSGLLTDMKGIQDATAGELAAQDVLIDSVINKCDETTDRLKGMNARMDEIAAAN